MDENWTTGPALPTDVQPGDVFMWWFDEPLNSRRLFGVDWYAEASVLYEFGLGAPIEVHVKRAEWWRRWGYAIVRHLP